MHYYTYSFNTQCLSHLISISAAYIVLVRFRTLRIYWTFAACVCFLTSGLNSQTPWNQIAVNLTLSVWSYSEIRRALELKLEREQQTSSNVLENFTEVTDSWGTVLGILRWRSKENEKERKMECEKGDLSKKRCFSKTKEKGKKKIKKEIKYILVSKSEYLSKRTDGEKYRLKEKKK